MMYTDMSDLVKVTQSGSGDASILNLSSLTLEWRSATYHWHCLPVGVADSGQYTAASPSTSLGRSSRAAAPLWLGQP
jgi:hypothetical protein